MTGLLCLMRAVLMLAVFLLAAPSTGQARGMFGQDCPRGTRWTGSSCSVMEVPPNAHIDVFGSGWECDQGFRRVGNGCEPVEVPPNAHIDVFGSGWECDQGFRRVGNGCGDSKVLGESSPASISST